MGRSIDKNYRKPFHGKLAATRITVEVMCEECPHFSQWIETLEALSMESEDG